ncbi:unnamed protein product [Cyprideis torosa]|uniref:Growth hormone-regulated TBC protein 1 n=1 Tax=Cyprideis torosa TaxID=163714 RepID=A0A7R8WBL7_9CRUS|nr:unnamed protein product [Cyprideis torosa]CAG0887096.1 unnamed protein product [Cyprideis torosa]
MNRIKFHVNARDSVISFMYPQPSRSDTNKGRRPRSQKAFVGPQPNQHQHKIHGRHTYVHKDSLPSQPSQNSSSGLPLNRKPPRLDRYGFEFEDELEWVEYILFTESYKEILSKRKLQWTTAVEADPDFYSVRSPKLKRYIRKGIPQSLRHVVWMETIGARALKAQHVRLYSKLIHSQLPPDISDGITVDLHRTFPGNIHFQSGKIRQALFNVLAANAHRNPSIGYCQGLNYVVGVLLLILPTEEDTFWLLQCLIHQILPNKYYNKDLCGAQVGIEVLQSLLRRQDPVLTEHMKKLGLPWTLFVTRWFICLFADVLPIETLLRVWDCLFYEGVKVLFRVALTLILQNRRELLAQQDMDGINRVFKRLIHEQNVLQCHDFIRDIFTIPDSLNIRQHLAIQKHISLKYTQMEVVRASIFCSLSGLKLTFSCMMELSKYPLDSQVCTMEIASFSKTMKELELKWQTTGDPVKMYQGLKMPQFAIVDIVTSTCQESFQIGNYSCLKAEYHLRRAIGFHLVQSYLPTILIVVISWVSFWMDVDSVAGRTTLGVTTLLTVSSKASGVQAEIPQVSYVKAIDIWMGTCTAFIFAALLEFTLVNYFWRKKSVMPYTRTPTTTELQELQQKQGLNSERILMASTGGKPSASTLENGGIGNIAMEVCLQPTLGTYQRLAQRIDVGCRIFFPLLFSLFNCLYWVTYLTS